jgi:hypothetical protein
MQGGNAAAGDVSVEKGGNLQNIGGKSERMRHDPNIMFPKRETEGRIPNVDLRR